MLPCTPLESGALTKQRKGYLAYVCPSKTKGKSASSARNLTCLDGKESRTYNYHEKKEKKEQG